VPHASDRHVLGDADAARGWIDDSALPSLHRAQLRDSLFAAFTSYASMLAHVVTVRLADGTVVEAVAVRGHRRDETD
jgi:hypothetical protein